MSRKGKSNEGPSITIIFDDYSDLQTRLVLLPYIEEEGIGAVVASYFPRDDSGNEVIVDVTGYVLGGINNHMNKSTNTVPTEGDCIDDSVSNHDSECRESTSDNTEESANVAIEWWNEEFSSILAAIRQSNCPIHLSFMKSIPSTQSDHDVEECQENKRNKSQNASRSIFDAIFEEKKMDGDYRDSSYDNSLDSEIEGHRNDETGNTSGLPAPSSYSTTAATATTRVHVPSTSSTPVGSTSSILSSPNISSSFWSKRFNLGDTTTLQQLASGAASSAASLARAANERATKLAAASTQSIAVTKVSDEKDTDSNIDETFEMYKPYTIYKQSMKSGQFCCVGQKQHLTSHLPSKGKKTTKGVEPFKSSRYISDSTDDKSNITNASLLALRCSPTQACPTSGENISYQWYRSRKTKECDADDSNDSGDSNEEDKKWNLLDGADRPVYQPSATEVGYRLKGVVRIITPITDAEELLMANHQQNDDGEDDDDSLTSTVSSSSTATLELNGDDGEQPVLVSKGEKCNKSSMKQRTKTVVVTCTTDEIVYADSLLFNGSRQALVRSVSEFSNLQGRGNANGRTVSIKISIKQSKKYKQTRMCAVSIYQVSGNIYEPIHNKSRPLVCVSAIADPGNAKNFDLILAEQRNSNTSSGEDNELQDSMVSALSTPYHIKEVNILTFMRFQLQAPNRLARESLLLTIGIASFNGSAVDLSESVPLYRQYNSTQRMLLSPSSSSISLSSWSLESLQASSLQSSSNKDDATKNEADYIEEIDECNLSQSSSITDENNEKHPETNQGKSILTASTPIDSVQHQSNVIDQSTSDVDTQIDSNVQKTTRSARRPASVIAIKEISVEQNMESSRVYDLEKELLRLREKLTRKDKIVSELQRSLTHSDDQNRQLENLLRDSDNEILSYKDEKCQLLEKLTQLDRVVQAKDLAIEHLRIENESNVKKLDLIINDQDIKIIELEKSNRTLHNEIAVLSAAVEARESKLDKMAELKASLNTANTKLSERMLLEKELADVNKRLKDVKDDYERIRKVEMSYKGEVDSLNSKVLALQQTLTNEKARSSGHQSELEKEQIKIQKLKAERNNYKQKNESLLKEINRVCKNGKYSIRDVEKIVMDATVCQEEIILLRQQKQEALTEAQNYRILLDQSKMTLKLANINIDHKESVKLMKRNDELERLLLELTEYVTAKDMQLDTLKHVNTALQTEIRDLAKASMSRNDV